ncbi:MAG: peroxidase family protein, partial [Bacteroidota bacterium]
MLKQTLLLFWIALCATTIFAQDYREIDGYGNNLQNPEWGAVGAHLLRITSYSYADGISAPAGFDRPNPRTVSNSLYAQEGELLPDTLGLSDYLWAFGQFVDHDITLVPSDLTESIGIPVAFQDEHMNPLGLFPVFIPMSRSLAAYGTGTDEDNPREHFNEITSFLDGSSVYGSDSTLAAYLRSFSGGKLRTSAGNLMPFNTLTGEMDDPIDETAPPMENENRFNDLLFMAGDVRANENPLLLAFHTIFVREHNRICDTLIVKHPDWSDEQIYQFARKLNGAYLQNIAFYEWLPTMGVHLPEYTGYDPNINPNVSNLFSAVAFRFHSLINSNILRIDEEGNTIPAGHLSLREAFFEPFEVVNGGGLDPLFKGMGVQVQQSFDTKLVDDLRNFLFGPPNSGAGGLDLASININRARERGIPDFNTIREDIGMAPYSRFDEVCAEIAVSDEMESLYGDMYTIDPFVGLLAEDHEPGALFGETMIKIIRNQFTALRDGDRFYFENDPMFSEEDIADIRSTTMRDIVMRNTDITILQKNVFIAMPHDSICPAINEIAPLAGSVKTENGIPIADVSLDLEDQSLGATTAMSSELGVYAINDLPTCNDYDVRAYKNDNHINGVSTYDIVLATWHILGAQPLDSPYKIIAADINNSGSITTNDLIEMRRLVLFLTTEFANTTSWRFIPADYEFTNPLNPLAEDFEKAVAISRLTEYSKADFIGVKMGDLNDSANPNLLQSAEERSFGEYTFKTQDREFEAEELVHVDIYAGGMEKMEGFQFALEFDTAALTHIGNEALSLPNLGDANFALHQDKGLLACSWNGHTTEEEAPLFRMSFRAKRNGKLSQSIGFNAALRAEAYNQSLDLMDLELAFTNSDTVATNDMVDFQLFQNMPNPFRENTTVRFYLPEDAVIQLSIYDANGRLIHSEDGNFNKGYNEWSITSDEVKRTGIFY